MQKADIIAQLQRDILPLQGYKSSLHSEYLDVGLGPIKHAFPSSVFPLGAVHEFFCHRAEEAAASSGFIAGILSSLIQGDGAALWIGSSGTIFPPALKAFGIDPDKIIFLTQKNEKHLIWATEEALKCGSLAAVVSEVSDISFTASRRFQLAVEQSGVTSLVLRRNPRNLTTACISRWRITPLASEAEEGLPGIGHARWNVELLKVRNGKPGIWQVEWKGGQFRVVYKPISFVRAVHRKAG